MTDSYGWRWEYWITLIFAFVVYCTIVFTIPETYAPTILKKRAKRLREETGDASYVTELEIDQKPFREEMAVFLLRPFQLLFCELIVFLISVYMSVLYGYVFPHAMELQTRPVLTGLRI